MPSPFPGMNPYLEEPQLWGEFHSRTIVAIADALNPQILPKYRAAIERRIYEMVDGESVFLGIPALTIPLQTGDSEPILDLQHLIHDLYDRAGFALVIDYNRIPDPRFGESDRTWLMEQLKSQGLRN